MDSMNLLIREYQAQLRHGVIQRAYQGILAEMTALSGYLKFCHPEYTVGTLYPGFMDMTYFAVTPPDLKEKKLKIAVVYLHEDGALAAWLSASNRTLRARWIESLSGRPVGPYSLSPLRPATDSILEMTLSEAPDFDHPLKLRRQVEEKLEMFLADIRRLIGSAGGSPNPGQ